MKTKLISIIFFYFSMLSCFAQAENLKDILNAANSGFMDYLEKIPKGQESFYGFQNRSEFALAKIGKPYQIFMLSKEFFNDTNLSDKKNYLITTDEWRVSVTVNGENRILLTVAKMNGVWQAVGMGASVLAKELGEFETKHPSKKQDGEILRVYQMVSDFVILSSDVSSLNFYPLISARIALDEKEKNIPFYSLHQVLSLSKKNLEHK